MNLEDFLFGSIGKQYCIYFYLVSVIGLFLLVIFVISVIIVGINKKKDIGFYIQSIIIAMLYGLMYFISRLLYNMCKQSI